jgi:toxin CcdB
MAQFDIYRNKDASTRTRYPYLIDVQVDVLSELATRLVVPLRSGSGTEPWVIARLHPVLTVGDLSLIAIFSEMAAVPVTILGDRMGDARAWRTELIAAADLLVNGF